MIAQLMGPNNELAGQVARTTQEAARAKDKKLVVLNATTETEIDAAFEQLHADVPLVQPLHSCSAGATNSWVGSTTRRSRYLFQPELRRRRRLDKLWP